LTGEVSANGKRKLNEFAGDDGKKRVKEVFNVKIAQPLEGHKIKRQ